VIKKVFHSTLLRTTGIYTFSNIINSSIPFILIPILTRYISLEDYGTIAMFTVITSFFFPFIGLNTVSAISISYFHLDHKSLSRYIFNCFLILIATTIIFGFISNNLRFYINSITQFPPNWIWVICIYCFSQFINQVLLTVWINERKPISYGTFQISSTVVNFLVSVLLIVKWDLDWRGRVLGMVTSSIVFGLIALYILWRNKRIAIMYSRSDISHAFRFGVPLIFSSLSIFLITMTDRILITNMVGVASTGEYALGYQIGMIINLLSDSFNNAWGPWLLGQLKDANIKTKIKLVKISYLYFLLVIISAITLSIVAPLFFYFFVGKDFIGATVYISWIAIGFSFNAMYKMISNYIYFAQKTHLLIWITLVSALINILLSYYLIKINGPVGAAQATTIVYGLFFLFTWVASNRSYPMPWFSFRRKNPAAC